MAEKLGDTQSEESEAQVKGLQEVFDKANGKRYISEDGWSLLFMFEDSKKLVIDICSPEVEQVSEDEFVPKCEAAIVIEDAFAVTEHWPDH